MRLSIIRSGLALRFLQIAKFCRAADQYDVSFQQMPEQVRLVPNAVKETNAYFSITPSFNREAEFAGTTYMSLRYAVMSSPIRNLQCAH